jgi:glycerophosphoryl diester phosphodiesterase
VEVDLCPLADGNFALLHDRLLEHSTDGSGPVNAHTTDQIRDLRLMWRGIVTNEPVGLLDQALDLVACHPHPLELQLDLKPYTPLSDRILSHLVATLQPVKDRVRVTSVADWTLRRLRHHDADLPIGFDPLLYLDVSPHEMEDGLPTPPLRQGAYGYWDDHPLAIERWGTTAEYLAARAQALWLQAPSGAIWYIRASLLSRILEDGFDWIATLHNWGVQVTAWTLNAHDPNNLQLAQQLAEAGVDRITTDNAPELGRALVERFQSSISVEY